MPNFGTQPRPGGDPPPRQPLTNEQIRERETFSRADHLRQQGVNPNPGADQPRTSTPNPEPQVQTVNLDELRSNLRKEGMDFQIFPIGEKSSDPGGRNEYREKRLIELESERTVIRDRMLAAESAAASAIRELNALRVQFDTLHGELESLKTSRADKET